MLTQIITPQNLSELTKTAREWQTDVAPATGLVERVTRGLVARTLRRAAQRPAATTIRSSDLQRILIILPYAIGDYIVATPLFEWLHQVAPQASIDIVVSSITQGFADRDPRFRRVGVVTISGTDAEMTVQMSSFVGDTPYDIVYAPTVHYMTRAMRLARMAHGSPILVGSEQQRRNDVYRQFFDHLIPHHYPVRHWCESYALAGPLAIEHPTPVDVGPSLGGFASSSHTTDPPRVLFNLSAKEAKRTVEPSQAIEVIQTLLQEDPQIVVHVLTAPNDTERQRLVIEAVEDERVDAVSGDLPNVVTMVAQAAVVISPDTSIVHMASCTGTPVVGLYLEPHKVVEWGPYGVPFRALISEDATSLTSILASEVSDAAMALLQEQGNVL